MKKIKILLVTLFISVLGLSYSQTRENNLINRATKNELVSQKRLIIIWGVNENIPETSIIIREDDFKDCFDRLKKELMQNSISVWEISEEVYIFYYKYGEDILLMNDGDSIIIHFTDTKD